MSFEHDDLKEKPPSDIDNPHAGSALGYEYFASDYLECALAHAMMKAQLQRRTKLKDAPKRDISYQNATFGVTIDGCSAVATIAGEATNVFCEFA